MLRRGPGEAPLRFVLGTFSAAEFFCDGWGAPLVTIMYIRWVHLKAHVGRKTGRNTVRPHFPTSWWTWTLG